MAALVAKSNVYSTSTSGDTIAGPLEIGNIKGSCGASAGLITLSIGGITVYSQQVASNSTPQSDFCRIRVQSNDTLTITLTGNASVFLYLSDAT